MVPKPAFRAPDSNDQLIIKLCRSLIMTHLFESSSSKTCRTRGPEDQVWEPPVYRWDKSVFNNRYPHNLFHPPSEHSDTSAWGWSINSWDVTFPFRNLVGIMLCDLLLFMQRCGPLQATGREALWDAVSHFNAMETSVFQRQSTGSTVWNTTRAYITEHVVM